MTFANAHDKIIADMIILKLSRAISILLLILYIVSIMLQIQSAKRLDVQHHANNVGEEDEGRPFMAYETHEYEERTPTREQRHWQFVEKPFISEHMKMVLSIIMLVSSAGLASVCANNMVSATEHVLSHTPLTKAFLGIILFPLLGNTTELGTAVSVALANHIDLSVNVSIGSAAQIGLFMAPVMVILGWMSHNDLAFLFRPFETIALAMTIATVALVSLFSSGHYFSGVLLCISYVVIW